MPTEVDTEGPERQPLIVILSINNEQTTAGEARMAFNGKGLT